MSVSGREVARSAQGDRDRRPAASSLARDPRGCCRPRPPCWPSSPRPDDESLGLGAINDRMTLGGAAVHVCATPAARRGVNKTGADLTLQPARELAGPGGNGVSTVALLDSPEAVWPGAWPRARRHVTGWPPGSPSGLLVSNDTGITGHPVHRPPQPRLSEKPDRSSCLAGLGLSAGIAHPPARRRRQAVRRQGTAAGLRRPGQPDPAAPGRAVHASQVSPEAPLWRRWSWRETSNTCAGSCRRRPTRPEPLLSRLAEPTKVWSGAVRPDGYVPRVWRLSWRR